MEPNIAGLWNFCREREAIRLRKEAGEPPPWTSDILLSQFHFCNIRRQDDYGTRWYIENVAGKNPLFWGFHDLLWKTILYRAVNNVQWFQQIGGVFGIEAWEGNKSEIMNAIAEAPLPYSRAYIVLQSPDGESRRSHLYQLLNWLEENVEVLSHDIQEATRLEEVWRYLQRAPFVGPFISLQVYRDLILAGALPFNDDDFTYLGPGCRTGLEILTGLYNYAQQYEALLDFRRQVPVDLEPLPLGDLEHVCCEARKYWRLSVGKGRRRYYRYHDRKVPSKL